MSRLKEFYNAVVVPELMKQFAYKSIMEVPRIEKIILTMMRFCRQIFVNWALSSLFGTWINSAAIKTDKAVRPSKCRSMCR